MKTNEDKFRSQGYTKGSDGIWRKEGSVPTDTASRSDTKPAKKRSLPKSPKLEGSAIPRYIAIVTVRTVRPRDYDGLGASTKYYFDALRHLGIIRDDSPDDIEIVYDCEKCSKFSEEETKIEFFQLP